VRHLLLSFALKLEVGETADIKMQVLCDAVALIDSLRMPNYLAAYSESLQEQAHALLASGRAGEVLTQRYPVANQMRTDDALSGYVSEFKARFMRNAPAVSKVQYDTKLQVIKHALGTHTTVRRVQGSQMKTKHEIRIASVFKDAPQDFLTMIVVHELAHLKVAEHDKPFYQLCCHMEPRYHQLEFDCRLYLSHLEQLKNNT
jgi:UTP pyrophosphatase